MENKIKELLSEFKGVKVLYACESGSRAWGFPSADSDWDVRFLYCHDPKYYFQLRTPKSDTLQRMVGEIDLVGWDIKKALNLQNAQLLEWLNSPIIYQDWDRRSELLSLIQFNANDIFHNYFGIAYNNYKRYILDKERVNYKKYLYTIRSLLACQWVIFGQSIPPVDFNVLIQDLMDRELHDLLVKIIEDKKAQKELDNQPKIAYLDDWIVKTIDELKGKNLKCEVVDNYCEMNNFFRNVVEQVYYDEYLMDEFLGDELYEEKIADACAGLPTEG